jgi:5-methylcytosine-specific restriction endonuclease McrA
MDDYEPTKKTHIVRGLRLIWLRSKERSHALKRDKYTCQICHRKQTQKKGQEFKVQVHHKEGVGNWDKVIETIREEILCNPDKLQTLCKDCHRSIEDGTL